MFNDNIITGEYASVKDMLQKNKFANLEGADLRGANLEGADLQNANLEDAKLSEKVSEAITSLTSICPEGTLIGWKKCQNGIIVKLEIPEKAKRNNGTGRMCRAEYVKVLEVIGAEVGISLYDNITEYRVGEIVRSDKWDDNRWEECSSGIHFFITRAEAEEY